MKLRDLIIYLVVTIVVVLGYREFVDTQERKEFDQERAEFDSAMEAMTFERDSLAIKVLEKDSINALLSIEFETALKEAQKINKDYEAIKYKARRIVSTDTLERIFTERYKHSTD